MNTIENVVMVDMTVDVMVDVMVDMVVDEMVDVMADMVAIHNNKNKHLVEKYYNTNNSL